MVINPRQDNRFPHGSLTLFQQSLCQMVYAGENSKVIEAV